MKYLDALRGHFRKYPAFTMSDVAVFLKGMGAKRNYLKVMMHNLVADGEVKTIRKGVYTFKDEVQAAGFGFSPFYYGLQDALSLRNLWEQETNPVVITPRKVRNGIRVFEGRNYLVRRISRKMFFGFEMIRYQDFWIPVSDPEKTLIDFAYFGEPLGAEPLQGLLRAIKRKKLASYLKRCPKWVAERIPNMGRAAGVSLR